MEDYARWRINYFGTIASRSASLAEWGMAQPSVTVVCGQCGRKHMVSFDPARYNITPQSLKRWKQQKPLCPQCMQSIDPTLGELLAEGQKADDPLNDRTQYDESVDMPDRIIRAKVRCPNCNKWHWEEINEIDAKGFASGAYSLTCPDCTARMIGPNRQSRP